MPKLQVQSEPAKKAGVADLPVAKQPLAQPSSPANTVPQKDMTSNAPEQKK
jgi:hypothetical protein